MKPLQALRRLPTFCWQTLPEVLWYTEQLSERIEYHTIAAMLNYLIRRGEVEIKVVDRRARTNGRLRVRMYKRREPA